MNFKQYLPVLQWLPNYQREWLKGDLSAGLTVGVMLIPQGMAYSMLAGLPPIYGLYASTLPLLLYAVLGTSRQLAVGPVAMVSLLTAAGVGALAQGGTEAYIALAISLAFMVGVIQFLLGVFRLGFLVNFLSHPIISGFTSASALIIGLSQLKHLLGIKMENSHFVHEMLIEAAKGLPQTNLYTLAIGLGGIALILGVKRINKAIPGPLLAVLAGTLLVWGLQLTDQGVKILGEVPQGLPSLSWPVPNIAAFQSLLPTALAIALVGFMESFAVAKAIQRKHRDYKIDANQELIGLGMANVGGSFLQAFPTTGGFSRTAVNDQAGARSGLAPMISASLIVLTLLFLTPLFYFLPQAILASVIMVAVFGLIDFKEPVHLWHSNRTDFALLIVTFIATLGLGIEQGIGVGVVLSLAMMVYRTTRPHVAVLGRMPGTTFFRNLERFPQAERRDDLLILRFDAQLYFANVNFFSDTIADLSARKGPKLKAVIIHAASINYLDSSAAHMLHDLVEEYRQAGIDFYFASVKGPVRDALVRAGLVEEIGENRFFMSVLEAVEAFDRQNPPDNSANRHYALQTNVPKNSRY